MVEFMREHGTITGWTVKANILGQMEVIMKDNTFMIRNMVMVPFIILMEPNTPVNGRKANYKG